MNLFTIGYSTYSTTAFIQVLQKYSIDVVADVRSQPYSQFKPEFNREVLCRNLKKHDIDYVFLGDLCGARINAKECYVNGVADYKLISKHSLFQKGLMKIKNGLKKHNIVLLCSEKDPLTCHRTILICRNLKSSNIEINHILDDGELESHQSLESRLMKLFNLDHPDLFRTEEERLYEAYDRQGQKIAFHMVSD